MPLATLRWQPILHVDKPVTVRDGRCDGQKKQLAQRIPDLSGHPRVLQLIEMCEEICGHAACGGLRDNSNAFHCCPSRRDVAAVILTAWQLAKEKSRRPGGASSEARLLSRTTPGVPFWPRHTWGSFRKNFIGLPWGGHIPRKFSFDTCGGLSYPSKEAAIGMPSTGVRGMLRLIKRGNIAMNTRWGGRPQAS